jgi:hypothetical protein
MRSLDLRLGKYVATAAPSTNAEVLSSAFCKVPAWNCELLRKTSASSNLTSNTSAVAPKPCYDCLRKRRRTGRPLATPLVGIVKGSSPVAGGAGAQAPKVSKPTVSRLVRPRQGLHGGGRDARSATTIAERPPHARTLFPTSTATRSAPTTHKLSVAPLRPSSAAQLMCEDRFLMSFRRMTSPDLRVHCTVGRNFYHSSTCRLTV